jgi:hypothetical protein
LTTPQPLAPVKRPYHLPGWLKSESGSVPWWLWLVCGVLWAGFTGWLWQWEFHVDEFGHSHLLAATAEAMAAILALVFTITLVVSELTAAYSHRLIQRLLTPFTIFYMLLFILATILPLVLIAHGDKAGIRVTLTLASLCLALLLPFFRYFLYRITPNALLNDLSSAARRKLLRGEEAGEMEALDNMSVSALEFKDYDTFETALTRLGGLSLILLPAGVDTTEVRADIWERLEDVAEASLDETRGAKISLEVIQKAGAAAVEQGVGESARHACRVLEEVGLAAIDRGLDGAGRQAVYALGEIGRRAAARKDEGLTRQAAYALAKLGPQAAEKCLRHAVSFAVDALESVGLAAAENGLGGVAIQAAGGLAELGTEAAADKRLAASAEQAAFALQGLKARKVNISSALAALGSVEGAERREGAARFLKMLNPAV